MISGLLAMCLLQTPLDRSGQSGFVTIVATSTFGEVLPSPTIKVEALEQKVPVFLNWRNGDRLPYGKYRFKVEVRGFRSEAIELEVDTIAVTINVALPLGSLGGWPDTSPIVLKLTKVEADCRTLILKHVYYSKPSQETSRRYLIPDQGTVSVEGTVSGSYFFAVVRNDGSICRAGAFNVVYTRTPIILDAPLNQTPR